jgi:hypothetical protein
MLPAGKILKESSRYSIHAVGIFSYLYQASYELQAESFICMYILSPARHYLKYGHRVYIDYIVCLKFSLK